MVHGISLGSKDRGGIVKQMSKKFMKLLLRETPGSIETG